MLPFKVLIIAILVITIEKITCEQLDGYKVYSVKASSDDQLAKLKSFESKFEDINFLTDPSTRKNVLLYGHQKRENDFVGFLKRNGMSGSVVVKDLHALIQRHMNQVSQRKTVLYNDMYDLRNFHNLADIKKILDKMAEDHQSTMSVFSMGKSYENRDIWMAKVTNSSDANPIVMIECGMHAREWISPAFCLWVLDDILNKNPDMLSRYDFHVIPNANPDGYQFTWLVNRLWRKNRRPHRLCYGVDLNRNFGGGWKADSNECSDTYPGTEAFSETEAAAIANHTRSIFDRILFYYSIHSYSQMWLYPYGHRSSAAEKQKMMEEMSQAAVNTIKSLSGRNYNHGQIYQTIYPAFGSSIDWIVDKTDSQMAFAIEMRDDGQYGFFLPPTEIEPACNEVWQGIMASIRTYEQASKVLK